MEVIAIATSFVIYGPNGQPLTQSGYGQAGASYKKRALKAFRAMSGDPVYDIDAHNATLRQRSRALYMSTPLATSAIKTNRTNVIGRGLRPKSRINRAIIGFGAEEADAQEKRIEAEFDLWASNKRACDATGVNDFYALQQLAMVSWMTSGDSITLVKHVDIGEMHPYGLKLHVVEADRISTPPQQRGRKKMPAVSVDGRPLAYFFNPTEGTAENGNRIHDGVEVDANGAVVAYYICSDYPTAFYGASEKPTWERVLAYGELSGVPNVLHVMDTERPDQYRGVPYLAHVIEPLLQMRRYTESEIMAAVVESFFTAFVKMETPESMMPLNEAGDSISSDPDDYEMGPGLINVMKPGEDIEFADPKRPTSGFSNFMRAMSEQVGAALEIPADLLTKAFNASYSASRAALLEAWKAFGMRRDWFVSDFCRPVYEAWMAEAVATGRIDAPGFFDDPVIRAAWLGSEWIGPSQGQLDPVKEITAEILAISEAISTHEQSTVRINGGSWDSNVEQLRRENDKLRSSGADPEQTLTQQQVTTGTTRPTVENVVKSAFVDAVREVLNDAGKRE